MANGKFTKLVSNNKLLCCFFELVNFWIVRSRNHLNDLENIVPFLFLALFYILVDPNAYVAIWHFRVFTVSRILHTLFYQMASQPGRFYSYLVGLFVLYSLAIQIICALL